MPNSLNVKTTDGPRGPKPRKILSRRNIILYGTLIFVAIYYLVPLYVMIVTSLKGMPEIRLGNIFSPPIEVTFEPWVKAWAQACTGLNCDGLSRGFTEASQHDGQKLCYQGQGNAKVHHRYTIPRT